MKLKLNRKGFTLVEILVVLMIVTIVMALAGSIVLSSFSLFGTATQDDVTKRSLDSLVEYVKSEITYAGDVRIASTKPEGDNWQSLDVNVDSGKLEENANPSHSAFVPVFSDTFYYGNTLDISISNFVDNKQFDMQFTFKKKNYDDYFVNVTIKFPNIELKMKSDDTFNPFELLTESDYLISGDMKLYYKSGIIRTEPTKPEKPNTGITGTVADQNAYLNNYNNRGEWVGQGNERRFYRQGDMVFHEGFWWYYMNSSQSITGTSSKAPGDKNTEWKRIDSQFYEYSGYQTGDVVIHEGKYYKLRYDVSHMNPTPAPDNKNEPCWLELQSTEEGLTQGELNSIKYEDRYIDKLKKMPTVRNTLDKIDLSKVTEYKASVTYNQNDLIKIYNLKFPNDDLLADYYLCVVESTNQKPGPTSNGYEWKSLDTSFSEKSAYSLGDSVIFNHSNGSKYITAIADIGIETNPQVDSNYWKSVIPW